MACCSRARRKHEHASRSASSRIVTYGKVHIRLENPIMLLNFSVLSPLCLERSAVTGTFQRSFPASRNCGCRRYNSDTKNALGGIPSVFKYDKCHTRQTSSLFIHVNCSLLAQWGMLHLWPVSKDFLDLVNVNTSSF